MDESDFMEWTFKIYVHHSIVADGFHGDDQWINDLLQNAFFNYPSDYVEGYMIDEPTYASREYLHHDFIKRTFSGV